MRLRTIGLIIGLAVIAVAILGAGLAASSYLEGPVEIGDGPLYNGKGFVAIHGDYQAVGTGAMLTVDGKCRTHNASEILAFNCYGMWVSTEVELAGEHTYGFNEENPLATIYIAGTRLSAPEGAAAKHATSLYVGAPPNDISEGRYPQHNYSAIIEGGPLLMNGGGVIHKPVAIRYAEPVAVLDITRPWTLVACDLPAGCSVTFDTALSWDLQNGQVVVAVVPGSGPLAFPGYGYTVGAGERGAMLFLAFDGTMLRIGAK